MTVVVLFGVQEKHFETALIIWKSLLPFFLNMFGDDIFTNFFKDSIVRIYTTYDERLWHLALELS